MLHFRMTDKETYSTANQRQLERLLTVSQIIKYDEYKLPFLLFHFGLPHLMYVCQPQFPSQ